MHYHQNRTTASDHRIMDNHLLYISRKLIIITSHSLIASDNYNCGWSSEWTDPRSEETRLLCLWLATTKSERPHLSSCTETKWWMWHIVKMKINDWKFNQQSYRSVNSGIWPYTRDTVKGAVIAHGRMNGWLWENSAPQPPLINKWMKRRGESGFDWRTPFW